MRNFPFAAACLLAGCSFNGDVPSQLANSDSDGAPPANATDAGNAADDAAPGVADAGPISGSPDAFAPAYSLALNVSGDAYVGIDYPGNYVADDGSYCGGMTWEVSAGIHNTVDDPLFQTNRYGIFTCAFGQGMLPSGDYSVTLLFGEVHRGAGCPSSGTSSRIYDVLLEGVRVLNNFDAVAESGGCVASTTSSTPAPVTRSFVSTVTDGTLNLELQGSTNGMISALRIESAMP